MDLGQPKFCSFARRFRMWPSYHLGCREDRSWMTGVIFIAMGAPQAIRNSEVIPLGIQFTNTAWYVHETGKVEAWDLKRRVEVSSQIQIMDHDPLWPEEFRREADRI